MKRVERFKEIRRKIDKKYEELLEKLKDSTESTEVNSEIMQQSQWIKEMNQAYKEAETEILERLQQLSDYPELVEAVKQVMQKIAHVSRDKAIEYGETQIQEFLRYLQYYSGKSE